MLALVLLAPHWLDRSISGYALNVFGAAEPNLGVHDAKRGYYLLRTDDCDGAIVTVTLTKDRNVVADLGYEIPRFVPRNGTNGGQPLVERSLRSLGTGKGLAIGATPDAVRARLGQPSLTKRKGLFTDFVYVWKEPADEPVRHEQRYTFRQGRLIEIEFSQDASPG